MFMLEDKKYQLRDVEMAYILYVLERNGGDKKKSAKELGIGFNTLERRFRQHKLREWDGSRTQGKSVDGPLPYSNFKLGATG